VTASLFMLYVHCPLVVLSLPLHLLNSSLAY
jgi:hypothetical protein